MKNFKALLSLMFVCLLLASCSSKDYKEACKNGDFETAHSCLDDLKKEFDKVKANNYSDATNYDLEGSDFDVAEADSKLTKAKAKIITASEDYYNAASYIFGAEVRFLISQGGNEDRIVYLFNELTPLGNKLPTNTFVGEYDEILNHELYYKFVLVNNQLANTILDLAINSGNKKLAGIAISHISTYGSSVDSEDPEEAEVLYDGVYTTYKTKEKKRAQEKFDEAVKQGLFD